MTDLLSQNIRCVCHIAWADFWGLLPGTPTLFTPGRAAPEGPATCLPSRHILCVIDGLYCVLLTGRTLGLITGNTYAVHPGRRRSRSQRQIHCESIVLLREAVPHKACCAVEAVLPIKEPHLWVSAVTFVELFILV